MIYQTFNSVTSSVVTTTDTDTNTHQWPELEQARAENFLLANYVRTGKRYCHINRPNEHLDAAELLLAALTLLRASYPENTVTAPTLRAALKTVTDLDGSDSSHLLPVWGGTTVSVPANPNRVIWSDTGTVSLNSWVTPKYRTVTEASDEIQPFLDFFKAVFPDLGERAMILSWLAWGLQHEGSRPNWGVMLYSAQKGTGKSTFAQICRKL